MKVPESVRGGLCSASALIFSMGMAFYGSWANADNVPFRWPRDLIVAGPAGIGFVLLGLAVFTATSPAEEKFECARRYLGLGIVALVIAWIASHLHGSAP